MSDTKSNAVLRRKATAGRREHDQRAVSAPRALRHAIEKSAEDLCGLPLIVREVERLRPGRDALTDLLDSDALLVLMDGPAGRAGACTLDLQLLSALIEVQTIGRLLDRVSDPRSPTRTDAAIAAPLIDSVMMQFAEALEAGADADWSAGFRFGDMIDDRRVLGLALQAPDYEYFNVTVQIGTGERSGAMTLALPGRDPEAAGSGAAAQPPVLPGLERAVMKVPASLNAVLGRVRLPLAELQALKPGDMVPVPRDALSDSWLEDGDRRRLAPARLGQLNGFRALRLMTPGAVPAPPPAMGEGALSLDAEMPVPDLPDTGARAAAPRPEPVDAAGSADFSDPPFPKPDRAEPEVSESAQAEQAIPEPVDGSENRI